MTNKAVPSSALTYLRRVAKPALISICLALLLVPSLQVVADETGSSNGVRTEVDLPSGLDMQVLRYPAGGDQLLIWLPSKYGIRPGNYPFASTVRDAGVDYWLVDLHESYLAPTGRHAFSEFDPKHVEELIDHAVAQGWSNIVLGGESRGAALAMRAAREWQLANPGNAALKGMVFFHPLLIDGYTEIGETARFHPVAQMTNLPVYIFQPEFNSKYLHSRQLIERLESGGAAVYFHYLNDVRGGFHLRDLDLLTPPESAERAQLGKRVRKAINLLSESLTPQRAAPEIDFIETATESDPENATILAPISGEVRRPLRVFDSAGQEVDLADYANEIVLVNFWASWCGPCVKEIASLRRLIEEFEDQPFRVLTVNISEGPERVNAFFRSIDIEPNFEVLFDIDGKAARDWRVYAVPSTYLLDERGVLRYGYRGALRWDKPSVVEIVQEMIAKRKSGKNAFASEQ